MSPEIPVAVVSDADLELFRSVRAKHPRVGGRVGGLEIKNEAGPVATVRIYDEIGFFGLTAEDFAAQIERITAPEIEVQINSPGGEVFDGIAIYNALRAHSARVTTRVDGMAASIASVIAQAGDHRIMLSSAQMMIHRAHGLAIGNAGVMREFADVLERQDTVIANVYATRAGRSVEDFLPLMEAESYLSDAETVELGLADELVTPDPKNALTNPPAAVLPIQRNTERGSITVEISDELRADPAALAAAISAISDTPAPVSFPIPDATPAPGPTASVQETDADPDADPASETHLLRALLGVLPRKEAQE